MVRVSLCEGETSRGINPTIPSRKSGRTESNAWDAPTSADAMLPDSRAGASLARSAGISKVVHMWCKP
jgi:hypothetical protein